MINRYIWSFAEKFGQGLFVSDKGDYVKYEDYTALQQKLDEMAAENAALKDFGDKLNDMYNNLNGEGTGIQGHAEVACQQAALEAAIEEFDTIATSATDAYLNSVELPKPIQQTEASDYGLESRDGYGLYWGSVETLKLVAESLRQQGYEVKS